MNIPKLIDIFPNWASGGGIFAGLGDTAPWAGQVSNLDLDWMYFGNRSGGKPPSPLIQRILGDNDTLTSDQVQHLSAIMLSLNATRWSKLYATLSFDYNPIENYRMVETSTDTGTERVQGTTTNAHTNSSTENTTLRRTDTGTISDAGTHTGSDTHTATDTGTVTDSGTNTGTETIAKTGTDTTARTGTESHAHSGQSATTGTELRGVYGFNSATSQPESDTATTGTGSDTSTDTTTHGTTDTITHNTTDTKTLNLTSGNTRTDNLTHTDREDLDTADTNTRTLNTLQSDTGTRTDSGTAQDTGTRDETNTRSGSHQLTRAGNIGVTTSQQMIESERELWLWSFFQDVVFPDVDRFLALCIY